MLMRERRNIENAPQVYSGVVKTLGGVAKGSLLDVWQMFVACNRYFQKAILSVKDGGCSSSL